MEDAGFDPIGGVVLHVLKIDTDDGLRGEEKVRRVGSRTIVKAERFQVRHGGSWH